MDISALSLALGAQTEQTGQTPVELATSRSATASVAVNGFVIDAIRKVVSAAQPTND